MSGNLPETLVQRIKKEQVLALPQSVASIMGLAKNPENGPAEFEVPISADLGLTSQILSFINSSYFGFRYKVTKIRAALSLISVRAMRNFVLWNAVFALLPCPKEDGFFNLRIIFQDAVRRGIFSKLFSSHFSGIDPDELFIAGMFQDIALPILVNYFPEDYNMIFQERDKTGKSLSVLEEQHFGWNHGQVGSFLVQEWGINDNLPKIIERHVHNKIPPAVSVQNLPGIIVHLSSLLPSAADKHWNSGNANTFFDIFYKIAVKKHLNEKGVPQVASLFSIVDANSAELLDMVKITKPANSLAVVLQQYSDMISGSDTDV